MQAVLNQTRMEPVSADILQKKTYIVTQGDLTFPNTIEISNTPCDPTFFSSEHTHGDAHTLNISDDAYIAHMIPHHQVAIDMSKRLLKTTQNDYMIDLAYNIIRNQQTEIARLSALSKSPSRFQSELIV